MGVKREGAEASYIDAMHLGIRRSHKKNQEYLIHDSFCHFYLLSQGLPTILSGRDLIGIAYTGSGKTLGTECF